MSYKVFQLLFSVKWAFFVSSIAGLVILAGCSKEKNEPLKGARESVLFNNDPYQTDIHSNNVIVRLPNSVAIKNWPVAGGNPSHDIPVIKLPISLSKAWSKSIGSGSGGQARLLNGPVAFDDVIYTIDTSGTVMASSIKDGKTIWQIDILDDTKPLQEFSSGLTYENGLLFCTTPNAEIVIIDTAKRTIIKRLSLTAPARAAPVVNQSLVYAVTINNQTEAFNYKTGDPIWSHHGTLENAGLLGGATPAIDKQMIIVPYTSGEVYALNKSNGTVLWTESLTDTMRLDPLSTIFHIKARPIIKDKFAYLISHGELIKAVDLLNGETLWQQNIGGIRSPAVGGDYLFMISNKQKLVCMNRHDGRVIWIHQLTAFQDPDTKKEPLLWIGPLITDQGCLLVNSIGEIVLTSLQNGHIIQTIYMDEPCLLSPIVASGTLLILTDNGKLIAYR